MDLYWAAKTFFLLKGEKFRFPSSVLPYLKLYASPNLECDVYNGLVN